MMWWDLPRESFVLPCLFVLGCCLGSFLNVCIHRFPAHLRLRDQLKSLNSHRSGCPRCLSSIAWYDNIPLLGWLMLRGKCRVCGKPISFRYPLVELLTGILFVVVYQLEMPTHFSHSPESFGLYFSEGPQRLTALWSVPVWLHVRYALHMALLCSLIVAAFIDLELRIIPDGCTVPVMLTSLVVSAACGQNWIVPLWFQDDSVVRVLRPLLPDVLQPLMFSWDCLPFAIAHPHWHGFLVSLIGLLAGGAVVWLVRVVGVCVLRQEAMGFGDVTLMAMVGSVVGWQPVSAVFVIAPVLAISAVLFSWVLKRENEFPYGPWLALASLLLIVAWPVIWPRAERVFDMGPLLLVMAVVMVVALGGSLQLVQLLKRILGIPGPEFRIGFNDLEEVRWVRARLGLPTAVPEIDESGGWTSADHLCYYNSERPDDQVNQWPVDIWPGCRSGQGLGYQHQWKSGNRR